MAANPITILAHRCDSLIAEARARGIDRDTAMRIYRDTFRHGVCEVDWAALDSPPIARQLGDGMTTKFVLRLDDGLEIETVIIPMRSRAGRLNFSLCVSSQVGCAMGCEFCETAQMGLLRNLSAAEIVSQWFVARHRFQTAIRNIVFMGMGEPMDNLDAVIGAIRILTDRNGAAIAPANIAVSTVGRCAGIRRFARFAAEEGFRKLKLAVSINAPDDDIRSSIMPINRAEPMNELRRAMLEWCEQGTPILIEYVLIPGVNDSPEHAGKLADYLRPLSCKVNVIPYNPRRNSPWPAPSDESVNAFIAQLNARSVFVTRRRTLGRPVMAACGQLGNPGIRRKRARTVPVRLSRVPDNL